MVPKYLASWPLQQRVYIQPFRQKYCGSFMALKIALLMWVKNSCAVGLIWSYINISGNERNSALGHLFWGKYFFVRYFKYLRNDVNNKERQVTFNKTNDEY
jgi:hypothetical protein